MRSRSSNRRPRCTTTQTITESLAGSLARDKAEHAETEREVAQLEATEDDVRERTRDSRIKFTGAIVCIVAVILAIILVWLFASK